MTYYNRDGSPCGDVMEWARDFEANDRHVGLTKVTDTARSVTVSTVFLGLDHSFGSGPPLIFETMTFEDGSTDEDQDRYTTEDQARAGHAAMVAKVAATMNNPLVQDMDHPIVQETDR